MARSTTLLTRSAESIGADLERDRLEMRARRLQRVVDALRVRVHDHVTRGSRIPAGLASSLDDFQRELGAVRRLLGRPSPSAAP